MLIRGTGHQTRGVGREGWWREACPILQTRNLSQREAAWQAAFQPQPGVLCQDKTWLSAQGLRGPGVQGTKGRAGQSAAASGSPGSPPLAAAWPEQACEVGHTVQI